MNPEVPPAPEPTLEEILLQAASELGREPTADRIADHAGISRRTRAHCQKIDAALFNLVRDGKLIRGNRGGFRLLSNSLPWQLLVRHPGDPHAALP